MVQVDKAEAVRESVWPLTSLHIDPHIQVFPSRMNRQRAAGMRLDPTNRLPALTKLPGDSMSEMVQLLLKHLGVPKAKLEGYMNRQLAQDAFVVGVADPTGAIPAGCVFVTGLQGVNKVFITRSPCVLPEDGRVLTAIDSIRPGHMKEADWQWLQGLPFGAVVFSGKGPRPLPAVIADGDLDGDLYFVLWNQALLEHIKAKPVQTRGDAPHKQVAALPGRNNATARDKSWLAAAQRHMIDEVVLREQLDIGSTHKLWKEFAINHGLDHPDTRAFAEAYKNCLVRSKHGTDIELPPHLSNLWKPATLRSPATAVKKRQAVAKGASKHAGKKRCAEEALGQSVSKTRVSDLKRVVLEEGLSVQVNVGGFEGRTKRDFIRDIELARKARLLGCIALPLGNGRSRTCLPWGGAADAQLCQASFLDVCSPSVTFVFHRRRGAGSCNHQRRPPRSSLHASRSPSPFVLSPTSAGSPRFFWSAGASKQGKA